MRAGIAAHIDETDIKIKRDSVSAFQLLTFNFSLYH